MEKMSLEDENDLLRRAYTLVKAENDYLKSRVEELVKDREALHRILLRYEDLERLSG